MNTAGYLMVRVDGRWLGIPVANVSELSRPVAITPVPLSDPWVRGLINLRGRIVPALDLAASLDGTHARELPDRRYAVLTRAGGVSLALLVDAIDEIVTLPAAAILPNPVTMPERAALLSRGMALWEDRLLMLLDLEGFAECGADVFAA